MPGLISRMVNDVLRRLGLELRRWPPAPQPGLPVIERHNLRTPKYVELVSQLEAVFADVLFANLPARPGRVELLSALLGTQISEAMYLIKHLHESLPLAGDVCEFGVAQGATSALLANEIHKTDRCLWLFDSFLGLPAPHAKDRLKDDIFNLGSIENYKGTMASPVEDVAGRLSEISFDMSRMRIVPGWIEETLAGGDLPAQVCFAYVDVDYYSPVSATLKFLAKRLSPGGYTVVDDYDFFSTGAKTAVDEFLKHHPGIFEISFPHKFAGHFCILRRTERPLPARGE